MNDVIGERWLSEAVDLLVRAVEAAGALVIFVGAISAFVRFAVLGLRHRRADTFVSVRLSLGGSSHSAWSSSSLRHPANSITPTLRQIGELAAVAAIRTALNFFLRREIEEERFQLARAEKPDTGGHAVET